MAKAKEAKPKSAEKKAVKAAPAEKKEVKEAPKTTKKDAPKKSSKKLVIIIAAVVLGLVIIGVVVAVCLNSLGGSFKVFGPKEDEIAIEDNGVKETAKIVKSEAKSVEFAKYDNGLVSFEYPEGWTVEVAPFDYIHYSFKVYNPKDPTYMILFGLKLEGFNKSNAAKNWQKNYYPDAMFAKTPVIDPQTTEAYFKVWNETAEYVNSNDAKSSYMPKMKEFTVVENLGKNPVVGGDILRATFKDSKGNKAQGLFTAAVMDVGSYYVNSNVFNLFSDKIDVWPLNVYNTVLMTAPDAEFNNWQSILDNTLATMEFSSTFMKGFNEEETTIAKTVQANQKIYDQMSDMIMDSWEKRNNSYDIISQKQSDATLGYERVYDTETGDIYKAYNGFTDDYTGDRYQPISDSQYTEAISGYIEK